MKFAKQFFIVISIFTIPSTCFAIKSFAEIQAQLAEQDLQAFNGEVDTHKRYLAEQYPIFSLILMRNNIAEINNFFLTINHRRDNLINHFQSLKQQEQDALNANAGLVTPEIVKMQYKIDEIEKLIHHYYFCINDLRKIYNNHRDEINLMPTITLQKGAL